MPLVGGVSPRLMGDGGGLTNVCVLLGFRVIPGSTEKQNTNMYVSNDGCPESTEKQNTSKQVAQVKHA